jgi:hypothetical protein
MKRTSKHVILAGIGLLGVAIAIAPSAYAQGYTLNSASLGTNAITMTIPKTGNTQSVHTLRLHYSGGNGANCTTGSLNDYWGPSGSRAPVGVTPGYSSSPMSLPSSLTRTIALNVYSTAVPMSRQWTIVVPSGSCRGGNKTSTVTVTLVKAK